MQRFLRLLPPNLFLACLLLVPFAASAQSRGLTGGPFAGSGSADLSSRIEAARTGDLARIGPDLAALYEEHRAHRRGPRALRPFRPANPALHVVGDSVVVDAVAEGDAGALLAALEELGLSGGAAYGRVVSGRLPIDALPALAAQGGLRLARPAVALHNVGLTTSQGDRAMGSDALKVAQSIDGTGVTVGVLSDSFDCLGGAAADVASNDLPPGTAVLDDSFCAGAIDEGRGMGQLIHDVAPGASLAFHTASGGQANFAQGILELRSMAAADVIVDDVIYFAEPMFQDGIIAQAADRVVRDGVPYFSSAGNNARDAYTSRYRNSGIAGASGLRHDFDPGAAVDDLQTVTIGAGATVFFSFQWQDPHFSVSGAPGAATDMDIVVYSTGGAPLGIGGFTANIGGDPVEVFGINNGAAVPAQAQIGLEWVGGAMPGAIKYIFFGSMTVNDFPTDSGTVYGHANARGAEAVGAAFYQQTPPFGVNPPVIEPFSSAGITPIYFTVTGAPLGMRRAKPEIVGPDGTNTTFFPPPPFNPNDVEGDGFPNFFGTSAAAPHVAAVAALFLEAKPALTPGDIYKAMESTAIDMDDPFTAGFDVGFDTGTGWGLIDANAAFAVLP